MTMQRPNMTGYFRAQIDRETNGSTGFGQIPPMPRGVAGVRGTVMDRVIRVTMVDGTDWYWEGRKSSTKSRRHLMYLPLAPKPLPGRPDQPAATRPTRVHGLTIDCDCGARAQYRYEVKVEGTPEFAVHYVCADHKPQADAA